MDRDTEKRLSAIKDWRGPRSEALKLDPGVLCPNAAAEAIAWANPSQAEDLKELPELKSWFVREFADEILGVLDRQKAKASAAKEAGEDAEPTPTRSGRRRSRGRSKSSAAKSKATSTSKSNERTPGS